MTESLASLRGLRFYSRRPIEGPITGVHRSPMHGQSVEFADHRSFTPGDDPRYLDWRAYARSGRWVVRRYEQETNVAAWLVVDASGSMGYAGGVAHTKLEHAAHLAEALAYVLIGQRDAVGLISFDTRVRDTLSPATTAGHRDTLSQTLRALTPGGETDLHRPMRLAAGLLKRRSIVVLLSDLLEPAERFLPAVQRFAQRGHELAVLQVLDPEELELPDRAVRYQGLEGGTELAVDGRRIKAAYQERMGRHLEVIRRACRSRHIDYRLCRTDEPVVSAVRRWLLGRQMQAGGGAVAAHGGGGGVS